MNANYAEIYRAGNLEADFQQALLVQFFSEIFTILLWNINNLNSAKKRKNIFLHKNSKNHFTIEIAQVRPIFGRTFICRVIIWEQNTDTEKTNGFVIKYDQSEWNIFI